MRENKILHLRLPDGLEITLHPEALLPSTPAAQPETVDGPPLDERGSTGMTRREQIDLLGQTFEADFRPVRK